MFKFYIFLVVLVTKVLSQADISGNTTANPDVLVTETSVAAEVSTGSATVNSSVLVTETSVVAEVSTGSATVNSGVLVTETADATKVTNGAVTVNPDVLVAESSAVANVTAGAITTNPDVLATETAAAAKVTVGNVNAKPDVLSTEASVVAKVTTRKVKLTVLSTESTVVAKVTDDVKDFVNETAPPKQTYKEAEKEITDFINSLLRSLLPKIIGGSGTAKLSQKCTGAMMKIFGNVRRLKGWTLKMLDSMGKPTAGILKGNSHSMGNYDQCVALSVTSRGKETSDPSEAMFRGMYCKIKVRFSDIVIETAKEYNKGKINATDLGKLKEVIQTIPYIPFMSEYMNHFLGLCFPSSCTIDDVSELIKVVEFPGVAAVDRCEIKTDTEADHTQLIILCIFLFLICLVIISTFVDWLLHVGRKRNQLEKGDKRCVSVTVSFSFCNNNKRLMKNVEDDTEGYLSGQSVRGIIVASVAWVTLGHTYIFPYDAFYVQSGSLQNLQDYLSQEYFSYIVNFPLAIDALFVCSGFLLTYPLWYSSSKTQNVKVSLCYLIVKHYIKLCLPLLMTIGVIILLPLVGSGPMWGEFLTDAISCCRNNIWAQVGMYSNFLDINEQCFPHLWYVSCLAQLTLIGIILCWILSKSMKLGVLLVILGIASCNAVVAIITHRNDLPPSYVAYFTEESSNLFFKINYSLPLSHFGPYVIGMLVGIIVAKGAHHKIRTCLSGIIWIACIALIYGLMYVLYVHRTDALGAYWSAIYAGNHRTVFGLCVAWVLVACAFDTGGFVNAIFSWRIFDPLYRLSYYSYLLHVVIIAFTLGTARTIHHYDHWELMLRAGSYIMASYVLGYFLFMMLEMPLASIKSVFSSKRTRQIDVTPLNNFNIHKGELLTQNTIQGTCKLWSIAETNNTGSY
ncbi:nose resistant to fluoxetine protein 6-like [Uloborus diversus]|uniref:nose resistant to fluoxetine protein 6-like n=1 Tax=Uloborus diversus TaxID=327109 RepID=UPI002409DBF4|nr:nose resistant to fluoxetine protein 6-like [Uloborus diversus]